MFRVGYAGWRGGQSRVLVWVVAMFVFVIRALWLGVRGRWDEDTFMRYALTGRLNRLLLVVILGGPAVIVLAIIAT